MKLRDLNKKTWTSWINSEADHSGAKTAATTQPASFNSLQRDYVMLNRR